MLHTIDKAILSPIVFQITFEDRVRFSAGAVKGRPAQRLSPEASCRGGFPDSRGDVLSAKKTT